MYYILRSVRPSISIYYVRIYTINMPQSLSTGCFSPFLLSWIRHNNDHYYYYYYSYWILVFPLFYTLNLFIYVLTWIRTYIYILSYVSPWRNRIDSKTICCVRAVSVADVTERVMYVYGCVCVCMTRYPNPVLTPTLEQQCPTSTVGNPLKFVDGNYPA